MLKRLEALKYPCWCENRAFLIELALLRVTVESLPRPLLTENLSEEGFESLLCIAYRHAVQNEVRGRVVRREKGDSMNMSEVLRTVADNAQRIVDRPKRLSRMKVCGCSSRSRQIASLDPIM